MKLSTDRILGLSAVFVGLGSLFIIVYQTYLIPGRLISAGEAVLHPSEF